MIWKATAPSNIAVIKYMGKEGKNNSVNPSLSMTLSNFYTSVEIASIDASQDRWAPIAGSTPLRESSTKKFMTFFAKLKEREGIQQCFEVRSGNNFPSDAGLASSASSFAALTKASFTAFSSLTNKPQPSVLQQALISREGSGSSCRSFFAPWCSWDRDEIKQVPSKLNLVDMVVVMESGFKKVSSSEAHQNVKTSPLFQGRTERAAKRMQLALNALAEGNYQKLAEVSWAELWDMHSLFHTSEPPFFYFAPETIAVLRWVEDTWEKHGTGPIATIDAGPNVHLLVKPEDVEKYASELKQYQVLTSHAH